MIFIYYSIFPFKKSRHFLFPSYPLVRIYTLYVSGFLYICPYLCYRYTYWWTSSCYNVTGFVIRTNWLTGQVAIVTIATPNTTWMHKGDCPVIMTMDVGFTSCVIYWLHKVLHHIDNFSYFRGCNLIFSCATTNENFFF